MTSSPAAFMSRIRKQLQAHKARLDLEDTEAWQSSSLNRAAHKKGRSDNRAQCCTLP